jgi:hypothetical protein
MISTSQLTNAHLNGILQSTLFQDEVRYLTLGSLSLEYSPGSEPVYKDPDFSWIPVPNYSGDSGDAQFLRYSLAKSYNFIIEPQEGLISVTMASSSLRTSAVEVTEARATAVVVYKMFELAKYQFNEALIAAIEEQQRHE